MKITINKILELKIPFNNEKKIILNNIHIDNHHADINKMQKLVIENGYYWNNFSIDVKNLINEFPICTSVKQKN